MAKRKRNGDPSAPQAPGTSMADLPTAIFYEIVLKLSTWSIVMSKSVCRAWRDLISDPGFAKMHFAQATPCPLLRNCHPSSFSRALYLLEPEDRGDFGAGYCSCVSNSIKGARKRCCRKTKVKSVLKLPIRNVHSLLSCVETANLVFSTSALHGIQVSMKVTPESYNHSYLEISVCNGFIFLHGSDDDFVFCNPITGEFIHPPKPAKKKRSVYLKFGLGFSPKSDQYKVLLNQTDGRAGSEIEIHTLGTISWRSLGVCAFKLDNDMCYFDGALHLLCSGDNYSDFESIACFDLDEEQFRSSSFLLPLCLRDTKNRLKIKVIGDQLCVTSVSRDFSVQIWAMHVYGNAESWTTLVLLDSVGGSCKPLSGLSDGVFWYFFRSGNKLIYCDKSGKLKNKRVRTLTRDTRFGAYDYTPSFISLKNMVNTDDVEVFNVYSGCGKIKLKEESHPLFLDNGK